MRVFGHAAYSLTGGNLRLFQVVFEFFPSTHRHVHVLAMDGMHACVDSTTTLTLSTITRMCARVVLRS